MSSDSVQSPAIPGFGTSRFAHRPLRHWGERLIEGILFLAAFSAVAITVAIVAILVVESASFFKEVPLSDFLTDTQWTIMFEDKHFGIAPLLAGTLVTTTVALLLAVPANGVR